MKGFPTIIYCKHKTAATKVGNSQYRFERAAPLNWLPFVTVVFVADGTIYTEGVLYQLIC